MKHYTRHNLGYMQEVHTPKAQRRVKMAGGDGDTQNL